jgi:hypothetical protein
LDSHESARRLLAALTNPVLRVPSSAFPLDRADAGRPGLYSWWADNDARDLISHALGVAAPELIYAGQAGATRHPSGTPSKATLASRIQANHVNGNASSSTFRLTISAILLQPLSLQMARPGQLNPDSNRKVSEWIRDHLQVAISPYDDRDSIAEVENATLDILDPLLNIRGRPATPARQRLTALRGRITHPDR